MMLSGYGTRRLARTHSPFMGTRRMCGALRSAQTANASPAVVETAPSSYGTRRPARTRSILRGHEGSARSMAFSPDGRRLYSRDGWHKPNCLGRPNWKAVRGRSRSEVCIRQFYPARTDWPVLCLSQIAETLCWFARTPNTTCGRNTPPVARPPPLATTPILPKKPNRTIRWSAACLHLRRLAEHSPDDDQLKDRLERAVA